MAYITQHRVEQQNYKGQNVIWNWDTRSIAFRPYKFSKSYYIIATLLFLKIFWNMWVFVGKVIVVFQKNLHK